MRLPKAGCGNRITLSSPSLITEKRTMKYFKFCSIWRILFFHQCPGLFLRSAKYRCSLCHIPAEMIKNGWGPYPKTSPTSTGCSAESSPRCWVEINETFSQSAISQVLATDYSPIASQVCQVFHRPPLIRIGDDPAPFHV